MYCQDKHVRLYTDKNVGLYEDEDDEEEDLRSAEEEEDLRSAALPYDKAVKKCNHWATDPETKLNFPPGTDRHAAQGLETEMQAGLECEMQMAASEAGHVASAECAACAACAPPLPAGSPLSSCARASSRAACVPPSS